MCNGNSKTDSCLYGSKIDKRGNRRPGQSVASLGRNRWGLVWILAVGSVVLLSGGSVFGQFTVQPMKVELPVRPAKLVKSSIELRNLDVNEVHIVDLTIVDLSQWEDGSWRIVEPNVDEPESAFDTSTLSSCSKWISLSPQNVSLSPLAAVPVELTVRVPSGVRGVWTAGIIAAIQPRPGAEVAVVLRFLIPVIVEIQARTPRHEVEMTGVGLEFVEQRGENPATTLVSMNIENNGGTYSRLKPLARVWSLAASGNWRLITTTEFKDASIIPGSKLKLKNDILRALPSGKYKVAGALYVDGKRGKTVEETMDFVGDPRVKKVVADAPLDLLPTEVFIDSIPGATRTASIKVHNASEDTVHVQAALVLPRALQGVAWGELRGDDLGCVEWTKIAPENFTLPAYAQQTIRVTSTMPNPTTTHPCYYALLGLWSTYPDGQRAGVKTANVCISDKNITAQPNIQGMKLVPSALDASKYLAVARFGNYGEIHVKPVRCRAVVTTGVGMPVANTLLTGHKSGVMLPLEVRDFSGVLDFAAVDEGTYRLTAALEYAPGQVADKQIAIRVSIEGERRLVDVTQTEEELDSKVEVRW